MTTPRSGDERFFTPRSMARTGGYISSGDEREEKFHNPVDHSRGRLHSARSWASDADYCTPRSTGRSDDSDGFHSVYEAKRGGVPIVPMPFVASHNSYAKSAPVAPAPQVSAYGASSTGDDSYYGSASYLPSNQSTSAGAPGSSWDTNDHISTADRRHSAPILPSQGHADTAAYDRTPQRYAGGSGADPPTWSPKPAASGRSASGSTDASGRSESSYSDATYREEDLTNVFSFARHSRTKDLEKLLNSSGIPANVRDKHGNTILIVACQNGLKRVAKLALRRGADINARNYKGNTCLHFCFAYGYGDTLGKYLMSKGADSTLRNSSDLSCFQGL